MGMIIIAVVVGQLTSLSGGLFLIGSAGDALDSSSVCMLIDPTPIDCCGLNFCVKFLILGLTFNVFYSSSIETLSTAHNLVNLFIQD